MSEQIYDNEIAPLLMKAAEICFEHDISMVATVEYNKGDFGSTFNLPTDRSCAMSVNYMAIKSAGNVDALIMGIQKYAREHGHSSIYMEILDR